MSIVGSGPLDWAFTIIIFLVLTVCAGTAGLLIWIRLREKLQKRYIKKVVSALKSKPYFLDFHFGSVIDIKGVGYETYAEAPLNVVLQYRDRPAALISFRLTSSGRRMWVEQMQGLKKAKFHGVEVGPWLVAHVDDVAMALGCREVLIVNAEAQTYFDREYIPVEKMAEHQSRLRRIYNNGPEAAGYRLQGKWWRKKL